MALFVPTFLILLGGVLLLGVWPRRGRRGCIEVNPHYESLLQRHGLSDASGFLDLSTIVVSGHPGRDVAKLILKDEGEVVTLYLKREQHVSWIVRIANALAGFGFVSQSLREMRTLRALSNCGVRTPDWVAVGEDDHGRAFLVLREVSGAVELRTLISAEHDSQNRLALARTLGATIAQVHNSGFDHPDLYGKHVLVDPETMGVCLLDWQRSRRRPEVPSTLRARDLAALNATVSSNLATRRERLACLMAYARSCALSEEKARALARQVFTESTRKLAHRHVREKQHPPTPGQQWIPLEGGEICVTPAFQRLGLERPEWLGFDFAPAALVRAQVDLGNGKTGLLTLRRERSTWRVLWDWARRKSVAPREQRQAELLFRLERYGVSVPTVLAMGCRRAAFGQVASLLLVEATAGVESLAAWLARALGADGRGAGLTEIGKLLRRLHEACCYLPDCNVPIGLRHGANDSLVPMVTGADGLLVTRAPSPSLAGRNLVSFQHELRAGGASVEDLRFLMEGYTSAVDEPHPASADGLLDLADSAHSQHAPVACSNGATTMTVTLDAGTAPPTDRPRTSLWRRLFRGERRVLARADWADLAGADWADRIMGLEIADRFHAKQGRSTCRWIMHADDAEVGATRLGVYLKRHYHMSWWRALCAALWPRGNWSPAFAEAEHLKWAKAEGVPVPEVVAAAEYIGPWGRFQSVLAVEELTGMLPLHEAVPLAATRLDPETFRRWKRGLVAEMARITRMLHDRRCFHKDLYLCHFYIDREDTAAVQQWRGRVFLIDLHRLTHHPWTWRVWQTKDLAQLLYSSEVFGIDARDRLQFWRDYRGNDGGGWLRRYILFRWRRYRRHNARRKTAAAPNPA